MSFTFQDEGNVCVCSCFVELDILVCQAWIMCANA
jgi:hypothetical protein